MKRCYYEILDVQKKATEKEIKTNYRKMALKYHPDKNTEEDAKKKFIEIQQAYKVLSDPNQRTWYDTNRQKILFDKENMTQKDLEMYSFGFNIWGYFTSNCYKEFDDEEGGFFQVYREVFQKIKTEETKAYAMRDDLEEDQRKYEGFGISSTSEQKFLKFYKDWESFSTYKTFVWSEEWDSRQAGNRWQRRQMEKENKKHRVNEKKNYLKTVKDLVLYIKKRDPRVRQYLIKQKQQEEKKEIEKIQREKQKKKEKEEMRKNAKLLEEQRMNEADQYFRRQNQNFGNDKDEYYEEDVKQIFCEICEKSFKSYNQLNNHEKSKQHKAMIKQIQKQVMLKQEKLMGIVEQTPQIVEQSIPKKKKNKKKNKKKQESQPEKEAKEEDQEKNQEVKKQDEKELIEKETVKQEQIQQTQQNKPKKKKNKKKNQKKQESENEDDKIEEKKETSKNTKKQDKKSKQKIEVEDKKAQKIESQPSDEQDFMEALLKNRNTNAKDTKKQDAKTLTKKQVRQKKVKVEVSDQSSEEDKQKKLGKAKIKKQKKAQQEKVEKGHKCNTCSQVFPSKTKLFDHVKKTGHASAK